MLQNNCSQSSSSGMWYLKSITSKSQSITIADFPLVKSTSGYVQSVLLKQERTRHLGSVSFYWFILRRAGRGRICKWGQRSGACLQRSRPNITQTRTKDARETLIMHLNVNSLQNKIEEVGTLIKEFKAQVVFLTETKIDASYPDSQFALEGYNI